MEDSNANATPKLKRSTYLSAMIGSSRRRSGGEWSITSSDEASTSTYTLQQHNLLLPAHKASGSRRKLRHVTLNNEGQQNSSTTMSNRDYFNLRRPKGTTAHQGRQLRRGSTSTTAASGDAPLTFGAGGVPLASSASLGLPATTGSNGGSATSSVASTHSNSRRRRVSADQQRRGGSLSSSSFNKSKQRSNSLQYYYPNPFSTTNLNDLMRLQQQQQQPGNTGSSQVLSMHSTSSSSGQDDRLDTAWLDQLDRQDLLLRDNNKNDPNSDSEEEEESIAPLSYNNNKRRNKKRQLPSGYRSLPQLQAAATTTLLPTLSHNNSYSTLNYFNNNHHHTMSCHCKRNFFQQVLDPIDGSDNDVNSRRRNEAWKEIRYDDIDNTSMGSNEEGVRVEEVSDDECRVNGGGGVKCRHQGIGSLLGECCMDSIGGIVSDDNDVSCSEESKTDTTAKRGGGWSSPSSWSGVPLPSSQRKRKSVDDSSSMSGEEDDNNQSSWTSPPTSLVGVPSQPPPRRVNTIGAGLAYGSDAWRSYQSKLDVRGDGGLSSLSRFRLSSSLGR
ncbi:hypothetical protein QTG54_011539 [Skeletonema marinoi]|uniref:Uncharacterized protein n=1 Tax=Skeletonema marinoi TaxID=267567 RepID=A0AAD8Y2D7_9STRA|nr:hypothetical protein QTG54_011539 [Skeletonema marinoi]